MNIVLKFVWQNILEKKLRTFLIIFSIMISASLFFASLAITTTMESMFLEMMQSRVGASDVVIRQGEQQDSPFFREQNLLEFKEDINYAIGVIETGVQFRSSKTESVPWLMRGTQLEDLEMMTPFDLAEDYSLLPFQGRKIIIDQNTAQKYELSAGENVELYISGSVQRFRIAAIAQPTGPFRDSGQQPLVIVPKETLSAMFDVRGRVNVVYISLHDSEEVEEVIAAMSASYPRHSIREALQRADVYTMVSSISTPFLFLTIVVLAVSAFIIYTSFKLIAKERMPVIGTFRSVGATRRVTGVVMVSESLVYGLVGGILGCLLGLGVLYIMSGMVMPPWVSGTTSLISFTPLQLVAAFIVAVVISFASSVVPIRKAAGMPLKDVILSNGEQVVALKKSKNFIYALLLIGGALVLPPVLPRDLGIISSSLGMIFSIVAIILLVPYLTTGFVIFFEKVYGYIFGNVGLIAVKNLRQNTSILNSISLLALGIASLLVVNTVSFSVVKEVSNLFTRNVNFDISVSGSMLNDRVLLQAAAVDGVSDVYGGYYHYGVDLVDFNGTINFHVPTSERYFEYFANLGLETDYSTVIKQLNDGRNIVITYILKDRLGLDLGDTLTIDMRSGPREYTVIGFMDTIMETGNYAFIGQRYHKLDMQPQYYQDINIKVNGNRAEVAALLKETFKNHPIEVSTMDEWEERNHASNKQLFDILKGFCVLTLIIGIFGVLNNLFISFIERKRALAVLRSVGMSQKQIIKMVFIESLSGGLIGGSIGVMGSMLMLTVMPYMLKAINAPIPISYSPDLLLYSLLAGIFIMVVASVSPALKSSKLNIVAALKYE